ncbi:MAG: permease, partial [Tepidanaerobacteraceae bacterium]|nr:permease [Tepidanaerobacteraceae bacterium]
MRILKALKRNMLIFAVGLMYLALFMFKTDMALLSLKNSSYYIIEMLQIIPVVFILTSLIDAWVPRNIIMNNLGEKSGVKGSMISLFLGSFSAGPIYAAFPICKMLLKKGASVVNIVIILSAWAVIKVPMLANEAKFLGPNFMAIRWVLTTISIFAMAYVISIIVKKEEIPYEDIASDSKEGEIVEIKSQYCMGCGVCVKLLPSLFQLEDGKATVKKQPIDSKEVDEVK